MHAPWPARAKHAVTSNLSVAGPALTAQVFMTINPDCQAVGACLSLWDDGLLAVAGPHVVRTYRFDIRNGSAKGGNVMMLVSLCGWQLRCQLVLLQQQV